MPAKKSPAKRKSTTKKTAETKSKKSASPKKRAASTKTKAKKSAKAGDQEVTIDRRTKADRRDETGDNLPADAQQPQIEKREKVQRRRQIDPTTCERDYSDQEVQFMNAMDEYKRTSGRMFPTCSEVLEVIRDLGYVQLTPAEIAIVRPEINEPAETDENTEEGVEVADAETMELETAELAV